ncbi:hypothetical protein VOLCADRAFT_93948 [Volvox carteri f. nagariensis]|uniref:Uncharacterized protein n=1 Tax=Volvox carteri f. nagariensis TaxID=3068 RepID=D8U3H9_VOLCA|nr:uncharacterized protein VOLCADRAFT_93948 [Volvox carteri f. nagariensis]EFJ45759.1 hypothetical protein VOLCADRAFT_93948 [Volvox carteri f. nagariensis]|eukprot:XP_002953160.1 hypothetical protein VOLCADRAFT_93948 [Volvox carteri f. nagariensis]
MYAEKEYSVQKAMKNKARDMRKLFIHVNGTYIFLQCCWTVMGLQGPRRLLRLTQLVVALLGVLLIMPKQDLYSIRIWASTFDDDGGITLPRLAASLAKLFWFMGHGIGRRSSDNGYTSAEDTQLDYTLLRLECIAALMIVDAWDALAERRYHEDDGASITRSPASARALGLLVLDANAAKLLLSSSIGVVGGWRAAVSAWQLSQVATVLFGAAKLYVDGLKAQLKLQTAAGAGQGIAATEITFRPTLELPDGSGCDDSHVPRPGIVMECTSARAASPRVATDSVGWSAGGFQERGLSFRVQADGPEDFFERLMETGPGATAILALLVVTVMTAMVVGTCLGWFVACGELRQRLRRQKAECRRFECLAWMCGPPLAAAGFSALSWGLGEEHNAGAYVAVEILRCASLWPLVWLLEPWLIGGVDAMGGCVQHGRKLMQMFLGPRRVDTGTLRTVRGGEGAVTADATSLPSPLEPGVRVNVSGGELIAVLKFDGYITPASADAARKRLMAYLQRDGVRLSEADAAGRFRCAQYGAVYQLGDRLNEMMLQVNA